MAVSPAWIAVNFSANCFKGLNKRWAYKIKEDRVPKSRVSTKIDILFRVEIWVKIATLNSICS